MSLQTRGNNIVVTGRRGVVVSDIAESIINSKPLEWIKNRFPVNDEEVFEVIDYYGDKLEGTISDGCLTLLNRGTIEDIDLEVTHISDAMFFKLLQYGRIFYPSELRFEWIFQGGLEMAIIEIFKDIEAGNRDFESSDFHNYVYEAVSDSVGKDINATEVLKSLPVGLYNERKHLRSE